MEVTNNQQTVQVIPAVNQQVIKDEQNTKGQDIIQNSDVTVNLSSEAVKLSSATEKSSTSQLQITNEKQAKKAVDEFKSSAANDPSLTQKVQNNSLTSNETSRLIS